MSNCDFYQFLCNVLAVLLDKDECRPDVHKDEREPLFDWNGLFTAGSEKKTQNIWQSKIALIIVNKKVKCAWLVVKVLNLN